MKKIAANKNYRLIKSAQDSSPTPEDGVTLEGLNKLVKQLEAWAAEPLPQGKLRAGNAVNLPRPPFRRT